eukprot:scaffold290507_cov27-Tisochrysis_lutea.AAC.1
MACSDSTALATNPASSTPRALRRVPAWSADRREMRQAVMLTPVVGERCSQWIDPWMRGVSHGPGAAAAIGASASRFHVKVGLACSQASGLAPAE